jgi:AcrR family transcriptional regulator
MAMTNIARRRASARAESGPGYAARREKIVRAAGQSFLAKGYEATSFKDIGELVELDRATLYYYFSSKQDLFQTVTGSAVERNTLAVECLAASDASAGEKVAELFRLVLDSYTNVDYPYMFIFLEEDVSRIATGAKGKRWARSVRALSDRYEAAVTQIFEQGVRDGDFAPLVPPSILTQAVIGMANWTRRWFRPGTAHSAEEIAGFFAETLLNGVRRRD